MKFVIFRVLAVYKTRGLNVASISARIAYRENFKWHNIPAVLVERGVKRSKTKKM